MFDHYGNKINKKTLTVQNSSSCFEAVKTFSQLTVEDVLFRVLDIDFGLSEGDGSDEEDNGNSSYLVQTNTDSEALLSLGRVVVPNLPSSKPSAFTRADILD